MTHEPSLPTYCKVVSAFDILFSLARTLFVLVVAAQASMIPDGTLQGLLILSALMNGAIVVLGPLGAASLYMHRRYAPHIQSLSIGLVVAVLLLGVMMNLSLSRPGERLVLMIGLGIFGSIVAGWVTLVVISIRKSLSFFRLIDFPRTASYDDLARVGPSVGFAILELGGNPRVNDRFCTLFYHHRSLERLDLSQTWITDDGVHNLVWMRRLRSLDLSSTGVTDGSLAMLVGMPSLAELDVSGTRCTAKGIKAFAKQRQEYPELQPVEIRFEPIEVQAAPMEFMGESESPEPENPAPIVTDSPYQPPKATIQRRPAADAPRPAPAAPRKPAPPAAKKPASDDAALNQFLSGLSEE